MEVILENVISYLGAAFIIVLTLYFYSRKRHRESQIVEKKIERAKEFGFHEPVSLHPVVNTDICIGSGACIKACPEQDILGVRKGQASTINASHCVGHGACFHACPLSAITLVIGTEKRGVELPHVSPMYESNVPRIFIAGELGGMGLIKNAVEQGKQAVENISNRIDRKANVNYDVIIIGAGPAGIAASLTAAKNHLRFITLEQDSLGGTVFTFPRKKIVMTTPMDLPLWGKVKLVETTKSELLELWKKVLHKNNIVIYENEKVVDIIKNENSFKVATTKGVYTSSSVLLAIGRRGSPRKLNVPGEVSEKVAYRLLEPELIADEKVLVVGGGDSAVESALLLSENKNEVTLSYRSDSFKRLKPKNFKKISEAHARGTVNIIYNSEVKEIFPENIVLKIGSNGSSQSIDIPNDRVYIFAGGELPNEFLTQCGIRITKKFGEVVLKH